jgi:hypothetical protein
MIPYEELDRALARWKARSQGGAASEAVPEPDVSSAPVVVDGDATPLPPIQLEDLAGVPEPVPAAPERTGEIDVAEIETYEDSN